MPFSSKKRKREKGYNDYSVPKISCMNLYGKDLRTPAV